MRAGEMGFGRLEMAGMERQIFGNLPVMTAIDVPCAESLHPVERKGRVIVGDIEFPFRVPNSG